MAVSVGPMIPSVPESLAAFSAWKIPEAPPASGKPSVIKRIVPKVTAVRRMPRINPASPMRFTMNAFFPASDADFFRK